MEKYVPVVCANAGPVRRAITTPAGKYLRMGFRPLRAPFYTRRLIKKTRERETGLNRPAADMQKR